ncbi:hypothetical protein HOLleu_14296 [Holothuria leucospilota]|uniref:Uncharacterized protein n=1 Tax=Holothuria leucospilota TaxID=206669 RepID=A0A9Q1C7G2_HOLLE|nr:hypothetical protein HOLleu_14296 [Holothuria leucospilota]
MAKLCRDSPCDSPFVPESTKKIIKNNITPENEARLSCHRLVTNQYICFPSGVGGGSRSYLRPSHVPGRTAGSASRYCSTLGLCSSVRQI